MSVCLSTCLLSCFLACESSREGVHTAGKGCSSQLAFGQPVAADLKALDLCLLMVWRPMRARFSLFCFSVCCVCVCVFVCLFVFAFVCSVFACLIACLVCPFAWEGFVGEVCNTWGQLKVCSSIPGIPKTSHCLFEHQPKLNCLSLSLMVCISFLQTSIDNQFSTKLAARQHQLCIKLYVMFGTMPGKISQKVRGPSVWRLAPSRQPRAAVALGCFCHGGADGYKCWRETPGSAKPAKTNSQVAG